MYGGIEMEMDMETNMEEPKATGRWMFFWVGFGALVWVALGCLVFGLAGCTYVSGAGVQESQAKVSFLDVGQGLAVLLEYEGRYALYDVGPDSVGVFDSLRARGVDTLEWVVASHYHRDHVGGLLELGAGPSKVSKPAVKRLYVGLDTAGGFIRDSLFRQVRRFGIPVDTVFRGHEIVLQDKNGVADGLRLKVLWPPEFLPLGGNESSVVLECRLETSGSQVDDGGTLLLTGDIDTAAERRLLELSPSLRASLLQVPHHGSSGSNSLGFLSQVSPRYAAISVGKDNGYGHPTAEVLRKIEIVAGDSSTVFRTDLDGTISFQIVPGMGVVK